MASVFRGRFVCKIDDKGRLALPAAFRLLPKSNQFVITNNLFQGRRCLDVYPIKNWENLEKSITELSDLSREVQAYQRFYLAGGQTVELDSQNRLLVPLHLRQYAHLQDEVVVVGMMNKFEIWPKAEWETLFEQMAGDFETVVARLTELEKRRSE